MSQDEPVNEEISASGQAEHLNKGAYKHSSSSQNDLVTPRQRNLIAKGDIINIQDAPKTFDDYLELARKPILKLKLEASHQGKYSKELIRAPKPKKKPPKPSLKSLLAPKRKNFYYKPRYIDLIPSHLKGIKAKQVDHMSELNKSLGIESDNEAEKLLAQQQQEAENLMLEDSELAEGMQYASIAEMYNLGYDLAELDQEQLSNLTGELIKNCDDPRTKIRLQSIQKDFERFSIVQNLCQFFFAYPYTYDFYEVNDNFKKMRAEFKAEINKHGFAEHELIVEQSSNKNKNISFEVAGMLAIGTRHFGNILINLNHSPGKDYFEIAFKGHLKAEDICIAACSNLEFELPNSTQIKERQYQYWNMSKVGEQEPWFTITYQGKLNSIYFAACLNILSNIINSDKEQSNYERSKGII